AITKQNDLKTETEKQEPLKAASGLTPKKEEPKLAFPGLDTLPSPKEKIAAKKADIEKAFQEAKAVEKVQDLGKQQARLEKEGKGRPLDRSEKGRRGAG